MTLAELCAAIALPEPVTGLVAQHAQSPALLEADRTTDAFQDPATWGEAVKSIARKLGDDPDGLKMLAFMLLRAAEVHDEYRARGIEETIFIDTMKFFTRFVNEHRDVYGSYGFTLGWWVPRQLSLREFRIGALEYELTETGGTPWISLHIPSDADLSRESLRRSWRDARATLARIAPAHADAEMLCDSWLLSPVLRELLPAGSNILRFLSAFDILEVDPDSRSCVRWVFGRDDLPLEALAERTSLQRAIKARLLRGGSVGTARGRLHADPWRD